MTLKAAVDTLKPGSHIFIKDPFENKKVFVEIAEINFKDRLVTIKDKVGNIYSCYPEDLG